MACPPPPHGLNVFTSYPFQMYKVSEFNNKTWKSTLSSTHTLVAFFL